MRYWLLTTVAWCCGYHVAAGALVNEATVPTLVLFTNDATKTRAAFRCMVDEVNQAGVLRQDEQHPAPQEGTA